MPFLARVVMRKVKLLSTGIAVGYLNICLVIYSIPTHIWLCLALTLDLKHSFRIMGTKNGNCSGSPSI